MALVFDRVNEMPEQSRELFYRMPARAQDDARAKLGALRRIHDAANKWAAALVEQNRFHGASGYSRKRLYALYTAYISGTTDYDAGDWQIVINKAIAQALVQSDKEPLPFEFKDHVRAVFGQKKGNMKKAREQIVADWYAGKDIPGYGRWYEWFQRTHPNEKRPQAPCDPPRGWSYVNLNRCRPDDFTTALNNVGISAALKHLPPIRLTRADLRPMERVEFDDHETDFLVMAGNVPCTLKGLFAYDVACALYLRFGVRPSIIRGDGTRDSLKRRDLRSLMAQVLMTVGYPEGYTSEWIVEHGQASVTEADMKALEIATEGHVKARYTEVVTGTVAPLGYADRGRGNPNGKPYIESSFNVLDQYVKRVEGHKGNRYDVQPAELEARKKEAIALASVGQLLPPDLRLQLDLPFQDMREGFATLTDIISEVHTRTDHGLEGFREVNLFRRSLHDDWQPYEQFMLVDQDERASIIRRAQGGQQLFDKRMEAPVERWARLAQGVKFRKIHESQARHIMDEHRLVTVEHSEIVLTFEGEECVFFHPDSVLLRNGVPYLLYFNSGDLGRAYLYDPDTKAYCGTLPRVARTSTKDLDRRKELGADKKRLLNRLIRANQLVHAGAADVNEARLNQNIEVLSNALATTIPGGLAQVEGPVPASAAAMERDMCARREEMARQHEARQIDVIGELARGSK